MQFDARGGISILELCIYFPYLCMAVMICLRHGFKRNSGWIYLALECLFRIVGACCQLALYSNTSSGLLQAALIFDSIGLSPLLLATLGLLTRFSDSVSSSKQTMLTTRHFRIVQLLIIIGLILSISGVSGGSVNTSTPSQSSPASSTQAGIILYCVGYGLIILITVILTSYATHAPSSERVLMLSIYIALPFLAVRLLYSVLTVFLHDSTFNIVDGSVAALVCMRDIEEFIIVGLFLFAGFKVNRLVRQPVLDYERGRQTRTTTVPPPAYHPPGQRS